MKKPRLTEADRLRIEEGLRNPMTVYAIDKGLGRPARTIMREIRAHARVSDKGAVCRVSNPCVHRMDCQKMHICAHCGYDESRHCRFCRLCNTNSCGKLTTGITVPQWFSILMLRNLKSPETYFQSAFRVQSPWSIKNPNGDDPNKEDILKPICFVFDFAPTRALRQLSEYGIGLSPNGPNPENAAKDLVSFLPVLAYDGANMTQIDAGGILDIAMAGTSATLLAKKWQSAILVNVDNDTLRRIIDNPEAMAAVERIEGWRSLGDYILETIINKSEKIKELKNKAKDKDLS